MHSLAERYIALANAFRLPDEAAADDLTLAYTRLFLGPGQPIAPPCESVYIDGQLMGRSAVKVQQCYAEAGLQVSSLSDEKFPDHISIELAFMAHLIEQEALNNRQTGIWRERQRRFFLNHLGRWMPQFCQRVDSSQIHPFYCEVAQEGVRLIQAEITRLSPPRDEVDEHAPDQNHTSIKPVFADPSPHRLEGRYPNLHLEIDDTLCTLCTFCTDNCHTGALSAACTPTTIRLIFDPESCNGCRKCLRLCPERAIIVIKRDPLSSPTQRPSSVLASAPRVICPDCHRPHIAQPWLERLADRLGGEISVRRSLAHCPYCKISSASDPLFPLGVTQESRSHAQKNLTAHDSNLDLVADTPGRASG